MSSLNTHPLSTEPYGGFSGEASIGQPFVVSLGVAPKVWDVRIPYSGYGGQGFQVFTPTRVVSPSAGQVLGVIPTSTQNRVIAIRVQDATDYQINGQGTVGTLPAGSITGIHHKIKFLSFPNGGTIEVM